MKNITSRIAALLLSSTLILTGCSGSLPAASSSDSESQVTIEDVRTKADRYWADMVFPQLSDPTADMPIVTMHTSMGDVTIVLYPDQAPKAVENFYVLAKEGYYDGVTFHRVIEDFVIQGGDPTATGSGGQSIWGESFGTEELTGCFSFYGALSMANAQGQNTSQFYIVQSSSIEEVAYAQDSNGDIVYYSEEVLYDMGYPQEVIDRYMEVGGMPSLDVGYTTFGQVLEGMDVVNAIAAVETDANDKPVEDVIIEGFTIVQELPEKYITFTGELPSEVSSEVTSEE